MSALLYDIKLPRKLDVIPRELIDLATRTRTFSDDSYEWMRLQRLEAARIEAAITALEVELAASGGGGGGSVTYGSPVALDVGNTNVDGVSTSVARSDHEHAIAKGSPLALAAGGGASDGSSGNFADASHKHATPIGSPLALSVGGSASDGSSGNYADASHKHATPIGSPVALVVGGSNTDGSSGNYADASHKHQLPAFGSTAGTFAEGNHSHTAIGGGYVDIWNPLIAPASPSSYDDEMTNGVAIDGKWTTHDPSSAADTISATTVARHYYLKKNTATALMFGLRQASPGSEYAFLCRLGNYEPASVSLPFVALALFQGTTANDDIRVAGSLCATGQQSCSASTLGGTATGNSFGSTTTRADIAPQWFRMRVNGTSNWADYSFDGEHWWPINIAANTFTAAHFGIAVGGSGSANYAGVFCNFRVLVGAGASAWGALMPGRMARVLLA